MILFKLFIVSCTSLRIIALIFSKFLQPWQHTTHTLAVYGMAKRLSRKQIQPHRILEKQKFRQTQTYFYHMKILILGAGKMGSFFCDLLSFRHDVAILDTDPRRLLFTFNVSRFTKADEVKAFDPDLVINAATVKYTIQAFDAILPFVRENTILSDIASVKTGLPQFYEKVGHPFVSSHPMFGPTFASLSNLRNENAIIIKEGDHLGRIFFKDLYNELKLNIVEYSFKEHDETIAYSLSIPFASTFVFAGIMKHQDAPGTTFKRHFDIARGLLGEDDYLLSEIMFNPHTSGQLEKIREQLSLLQQIVESHDSDAMTAYLSRLRDNLK